MYRLLLCSIICLALFSCRNGFDPAITQDEIEEHIAFLASDELRGRYPGSPEDEELSSFITTRLKHAGLQMYNRNGIQSFEIATDLEPGPGNAAKVGAEQLKPFTDFTPLSFSPSGTVHGELAFAGYGFQIEEPELTWNDYKDLDVTNKWVMVLRGIPGEQEDGSPYVNFSDDRGKALLAADMGAGGVILVSGLHYDPSDGLDALTGRQHALSIPVIQITRKAADRILLRSGADSLSVIDSEITGSLKPHSFLTGMDAEITTDLKPKMVKTFNVIGTLEGSDPSLSSQYVIIGAHHDHLGMGGMGSTSRQPDTIAIHHGADDNASGVAGVIELAERMPELHPGRSILFATFGAEEMGLVGSKYFTEHPPVDLSKVQVMINLDMIGRLNEDKQLQIGGVGTSPGFQALLDSINGEYDFNLKFGNEGYGPSDHASFYANDVPVLFVTTGAHPQYHMPSDQLKYINLEGEKEVLDFVSEVATVLASEKERIAFTEAGPKVKTSSRGRYGGITLGLMPDVTYDGNEGMPVMFVTEGKPASAGGILKGDTISAIEGKPVGNVYDYMERLKPLKEGMDIVVTVKRGGDKLDLVIRL